MGYSDYNPVLPTWGSSLGGGISSGFDSVMEGLAQRYKLEQEAVKNKSATRRQDLNFAATTGYDPESIIRGGALHREYGGVPDFGPENAGNLMTPEEKGLWGEYSNFQSDMRKIRGAKVAGKSGDFNPVQESQIEYFATALAHGEMSMDQLAQATGMGGGAIRSESVRRASLKNPEFTPLGSHLDYAGQTSETKYLHSGQAQTVTRTANAIIPNLGKLKQMSMQIPRTDIQIVNHYGLDVAEKYGGSVAVSNLKTQAGLIADEIQAVYGRGSDQKLDLIQDMLRGSKSIDQLNGAIDIASENLGNRVVAFGGKPAQMPATSGGGLNISEEQRSRAQEILDQRQRARGGRNGP